MHERTNKISFYVLLTVHPGMILANNQLDAQFFLVCLFLFSTYFGQPCAHHQENYCINVTLGLCHSNSFNPFLIFPTIDQFCPCLYNHELSRHWKVRDCTSKDKTDLVSEKSGKD